MRSNLKVRQFGKVDKVNDGLTISETKSVTVVGCAFKTILKIGC